ncbi:Zinc ABC transporter, ATP-binding protein ZnuC, partial [hydrothermal vent metagenome]
DHKNTLKIGFMPQKIHIDATLPMSVKRFLELGLPKNNTQKPTPEHLLLSKLNSPCPPSFKTRLRQLFSTATYDSTRLDKLTKELQLSALLSQPIQQVSGGEMQRILLARALMGEPELLVLDEPVQGVDIKGQAELYQYIDHIRHHYGCGILMVSHDLHIVMQHTDQVLCLNQHICCTGHPKDVSESPEFQTLFTSQPEGIALYEHHHDHNTCEHTHGQTLDQTHDSKNSPPPSQPKQRGEKI